MLSSGSSMEVDPEYNALMNHLNQLFVFFRHTSGKQQSLCVQDRPLKETQVRENEGKQSTATTDRESLAEKRESKIESKTGCHQQHVLSCGWQKGPSSEFWQNLATNQSSRIKLQCWYVSSETIYFGFTFHERVLLQELLQHSKEKWREVERNGVGHARALTTCGGLAGLQDF
eukprot:6441988-Amphidinium_carterae.1